MRLLTRARELDAESPDRRHEKKDAPIARF